MSPIDVGRNDPLHTKCGLKLAGEDVRAAQSPFWFWRLHLFTSTGVQPNSRSAQRTPACGERPDSAPCRQVGVRVRCAAVPGRRRGSGGLDAAGLGWTSWDMIQKDVSR
jgi:hypothetical protein